MSDIKIADPQGEWFMNTALFRMHDPESDTYFEPGIPTKATKTKWLRGGEGNDLLPGQVMIISIKDPSAPEVVERSKEAMKQARIQKNGEDPEPKKD
jgi:hypothetical protein